MIILKLGGSILTEKYSEAPMLNEENVSRIAHEISESSYEGLVIVHGAGSFGHPFANKYSIGNKIQDEKDLRRKMLGFSITQHSVRNLNNMICEHLRMHDILSVSIQPSTFIITENKRIFSANLDLINKYLHLGFVPVLYGDVVLDVNKSIKFAVLSGDQIVKYLSENLKPDRVIMASDVDGVYNKDPKENSDAQLLEVVTSIEQIGNSNEQDQTMDVTGRMRGKLSELLELANLGVESEIINANTLNIIKNALNGEKVHGTLIKKV